MNLWVIASLGGCLPCSRSLCLTFTPRIGCNYKALTQTHDEIKTYINNRHYFWVAVEHLTILCEKRTERALATYSKPNCQLNTKSLIWVVLETSRETLVANENSHQKSLYLQTRFHAGAGGI